MLFLSYDKDLSCVKNIKISDENEITVLYTHFMENQKNSWNYVLHSHSFFEFHAVIRGNCVMEFDDGVLNISENEYVLIPPGKKHVFKQCSDDFFRFSTAFNAGFESVSKTEVLSLNEKCVFYISDILEEYEKNQTGYKNVVNADITSLLIEILRSLGMFSQFENRGKSLLSVSKALQFIDNNVSHKITVGDVSEETFLSVRHLNRLFNDKFGMSVTEYIKHRKISDAEEYLKKTDFTVKEIAFLTGFDGEPYFCKLFKRKTGFSPKEYRKYNVCSDLNL